MEVKPKKALIMAYEAYFSWSMTDEPVKEKVVRTTQ